MTESITELLKRQGKLDGDGCVPCPTCGEIIPLVPGAPERLRHAIIVHDGRVYILCPNRVIEVMGWVTQQ